jgi:GTP-binding protein Era
MENNLPENFKSGFVAIMGRPNVGKSTLMNNILGQKIAAVSPRPQTTRKNQLGILTLEDAQIIFTDTPGLHHHRHKLGKHMNEEAIAALEESDLVIFMVDGSVNPHEEDLLLAGVIQSSSNIPAILLMNKIDIISEQTLLKRITLYKSLLPKANFIPISAETGEGIDSLLESIINLLPDGPPLYPSDQVTTSFERDIAANLIREAALNLLRDEVPHCLAVRIDEYIERGDTGANIEATLFVERDSQKGIVIGRGGKMIKAISTAARKQIEAMSGRKVFLRTRVKVRKNWRNDEQYLKSFGFQTRKE